MCRSMLSSTICSEAKLVWLRRSGPQSSENAHTGTGLRNSMAQTSLQIAPEEEDDYESE